MESLINGIAATLYDECECGCNNLTRSPEAKFLPGHDQRLVSRIAQDLAHARISEDYAKVTFIVGEQAQRWPNLSEKIENAAWKLEAKLVKQAQKRSKQLHAAVEDLDAELETTGELTVKVGRWEYPAKMNNLGLVWRNTKREGSGEWIRHTEKGRYVSAA